MRLDTFIEENREKIIAEWVQFAATLLPSADGMSERELRDHADEMLQAVVLDMRTPQSTNEQSDKSQGNMAAGALADIGHKHASQRLDHGFDLDQLVSEYRALRASVLRLWAEAAGGDQADVTRFNEAIDESLVEATSKYSKLMDHTREQFLAILGHDLRNPLSAIILGATLLTKSEGFDEKEARVATRILNTARRMNRMVSDLEDLTRARLGGGIPIAAMRMDLAPVCEQVVAELEVVQPASHVRFESKGVLLGEWDSMRVTQLISILVANAVGRGGGEGGVSLIAEERNGEVVLRVHDEGPTIPPHALRTVFEPMFHRGEQEGDREAALTGLGLYIAQEIVTAHAGTIEVSSTEKDGTTFLVRLPRHPPLPRHA